MIISGSSCAPDVVNILNFVVLPLHPSRFAIYIPLFLPISVPILLSSVAALKWVAAGFKSKDSASTGGKVSEKSSDSHSAKVSDSTGTKDKVE